MLRVLAKGQQWLEDVQSGQRGGKGSTFPGKDPSGRRSAEATLGVDSPAADLGSKPMGILL